MRSKNILCFPAMISRYLQNLSRELNAFLSSSSVHGLPYIHRTQSRTTRLIWTVLVAMALTMATAFLMQTVGNWDTKYISTTVETRGVESYPFPAVTFHSGVFPIRKQFLRTFLNHLELTRPTESSPLYENSVFMKKYSNFVNYFGPKSSSLFDWVPGRVHTEFLMGVCFLLLFDFRHNHLVIV